MYIFKGSKGYEVRKPRTIKHGGVLGSVKLEYEI